jgi:subtilisin-like proprotein convertase family protein
MKPLIQLLIISAGLVYSPLRAASIIEIHSFNDLNLAIPDGNPSGLANLQPVTSAITKIEDITVTLNTSGSFNGDLYVYLQHDSGFSVLLNRVGRTAGNAFGYNDAGFQLSFNDLTGGHPDVHLYQNSVGPSNPLMGIWGSDGRAIDPDLVVDTDPRTADLTSFTNADANGDWTLYLADVSSGASHTLDSWSMEITGIPEPSSSSLLILAAAMILSRRQRI